MQEYQYSAKIYDPLLSPFMKPIRRRVSALVKKYKYASILDVCCGTGDQLKLLKRDGFDGLGVDLSDAMLEVSKAGEYPADCMKQDAAEMAFDEGSFDLVMTSFALHEKEHSTARKIVEEMVRVTKEGGEILIVDYELSEKTSLFSKWMIYFIEWLAGGEHYRNFRSYIEKGGLPALLSGTGISEKKRYYFGQNGIVLVLYSKGSE
jgi:demethylmenaquinone methyltransferase/2-methoxy-6-polyprenyl-1,4-benzoquinol methylase